MPVWRFLSNSFAEVYQRLFTLCTCWVGLGVGFARLLGQTINDLLFNVPRNLFILEILLRKFIAEAALICLLSVGPYLLCQVIIVMHLSSASTRKGGGLADVGEYGDYMGTLHHISAPVVWEMWDLEF